MNYPPVHQHKGIARYEKILISIRTKYKGPPARYKSLIIESLHSHTVHLTVSYNYSNS